MQNYTKYTFNSTNEILVARLFDLGFDSFQGFGEIKNFDQNPSFKSSFFFVKKEKVNNNIKNTAKKNKIRIN